MTPLRPSVAPDAASYPKRRAGLLEGTVHDELVLYDPGAERLFTLNRSARAVWALCDGTRSLATITAELAAWLERRPDELWPDVLASIVMLDELGLLDAGPPVRPG